MYLQISLKYESLKRKITDNIYFLLIPLFFRLLQPVIIEYYYILYDRLLYYFSQIVQHITWHMEITW